MAEIVPTEKLQPLDVHQHQNLLHQRDSAIEERDQAKARLAEHLAFKAAALVTAAAQPRINWIQTGIGLLFGSGQVAKDDGWYGRNAALEVWIAEGVTRGFIPAAPGGQAANVVTDSDFAAYPTVTAAIFLAAVSVLQTLNATYTTAANFAALIAIKP